MSQYFNITSKLTQELIAVGSNISVSKIHLINVQDNFHCKVDLYIEKKLKGKFYLLKEVILSKGENLIYTNPPLSNATGEFGLYIKVTNNSSDTTGLDVIIE